ncbi:hypothetical protein [Paraburkholderia humisilvae]|uniref:Uncharacterized protein n=1 Tax=Paraburkholderia humisilvae TaxID=627669 RepID=A0A6J5FBF4_9BURK|nr:hypothetical protein [Paraburkholderia humisilvae]CAB3774545.1 hypothetical protein LMG29542_07922 [Paraburkholderia humisilvae]
MGAGLGTPADWLIRSTRECALPEEAKLPAATTESAPRGEIALARGAVLKARQVRQHVWLQRLHYAKTGAKRFCDAVLNELMNKRERVGNLGNRVNLSTRGLADKITGLEHTRINALENDTKSSRPELNSHKLLKGLYPLVAGDSNVLRDVAQFARLQSILDLAFGDEASFSLPESFRPMRTTGKGISAAGIFGAKVAMGTAELSPVFEVAGAEVKGTGEWTGRRTKLQLWLAPHTARGKASGNNTAIEQSQSEHLMVSDPALKTYLASVETEGQSRLDRGIRTLEEQVNALLPMRSEMMSNGSSDNMRLEAKEVFGKKLIALVGTFKLNASDIKGT